MYRIAFLLVAGLVATGSGCRGGYHRLPPPTDRSTVLLVRNEHASPVTIFALVGSARQQVGRVEGGASGRFVLRREVVAARRVRFLASEFHWAVTSEEVLIAEGDVVEWTVPGPILVRPN